MRNPFGSFLNRWTLPVLAICPFLTGCCTQMFGNAIEFVRTQAPQAKDVAVILLEPNGKYYPDRLYVKNQIHMIVWITEADSLEVQFKEPKPPVPVKCSRDIRDQFKFLCFTAAPFNLNPSDPRVYKYKATIRCKGKDPVTIDPEVEIVF